jgi:hypothetical protein
LWASGRQEIPIHQQARNLDSEDEEDCRDDENDDGINDEDMSDDEEDFASQINRDVQAEKQYMN